MVRSRVDLPEPVRPTTRTSSPSGMARSHAGEHRRGGVGVGHARPARSSITRPPPARRPTVPTTRTSATRRRTGRGRRAAAPTRMPAQREQRHRRHVGRRWPGRSRAGDRCTSTNTDGGRDHAAAGDQPLGQRPRVGAVAGAAGAPPAEVQPDGRDDRADQQHRQARARPTRCRRAGRRRRCTRRAARRGPATAVTRRATRSSVRRTPVAAGVHRRGQVDRALERALEHRHREPPQAAAARVPCGRAAGGAARTRAGVGDQLRGEGQRDRRRRRRPRRARRARSAAAAGRCPARWRRRRSTRSWPAAARRRTRRSTASRVTTPPSLSPLPAGIGSDGSVNSTVRALGAGRRAAPGTRSGPRSRAATA